MRLSELLIQSQRLLGSSFGFGKGILSRCILIPGKCVVGGCESRVGERILRIQLDGLAKIVDTPLDRLLASLVQEVATAKIELIRLRVRSL